MIHFVLYAVAVLIDITISAAIVLAVMFAIVTVRGITLFVQRRRKPLHAEPAPPRCDYCDGFTDRADDCNCTEPCPLVPWCFLRVLAEMREGGPR